MAKTNEDWSGFDFTSEAIEKLKAEHIAGLTRLYILYDGRACSGGDTDKASVLVACDSDEEAQSYKGDFGEMACYSYRIDKDNGNELIDEKWEWDYRVSNSA